VDDEHDRHCGSFVPLIAPNLPERSFVDRFVPFASLGRQHPAFLQHALRSP
jgi:hypothetical protein